MSFFCSKHVNTEESILQVVKILSNDDAKKFEIILNYFQSLGINKIKDLARATIEEVNEMASENNLISNLYDAIQVYDELCASRFKSAKLLYEKGYYIKAQEVCQTLISYQPRELNILLLLSASYFMHKQYNKSVETLNCIPNKYRGCVEVLNNLGSNCLRQGLHIEARDYFYKAICKKPDYIDCWINYVKSLIKINDHSNAILALKMIINYEPDLILARHLYGKLLITLDKVDDAAYQFKAAIHSKPDCALSWVLLGNLYYNSDEINTAIVCYEKATELKNYSITPRINLGLSYLKLREYDKSIEILKSALQLCPVNMYILKIIARVFFAQKNILAAIRTYSLCLKHEPDNADLHYDLGVLYFACLKNATAAEPYFKKCLDLDSTNEKYYRCLAMTYQEQNKFEEAYKITITLGDMYLNQNDINNARSTYYYATHIFPQSYYAHWKLGHIFYKLEHCDKSLLRYESAKELKPNFAFSFSDIALIREEQNQLETAEIFYEIALQLQPNHYNIIHNLIILKQKIGRIDDIIGLFSLLLKHKTLDSYELHRDMSNFLLNEIGNNKEAHTHLIKALNIRDFDLEGYLTLGNLLLELKNIDEALVYFYKAIEIESDSITARINIGCILKDTNKFNEAINIFEEILNLKPNHPDALCNLIQCQQYICHFKNLTIMQFKKLKDIVLKQLSDNQVPCVSPQQSLILRFKPNILKKIAIKYAEQFVGKPYIKRNLSRRYVHEKLLTPNCCLRIGYIFSDLNGHPISELVKCIQKLHNKNKVQVFCYSLSPITTSSRTNSLPENIIDISNLRSIDAANNINANRIHILVNINGSPKGIHNEILALRPAPVQVKLLGHPGTSGATFVDYLVTDIICSPKGSNHLYTEKLVYMNRTVFFGDHKILFNDLSQRNPQNRTYVNDPEEMCVNENNSCDPVSNNSTSMYSFRILPDNSIKCYTRQMYNLPEDSIVYCYFGQLCKISETTLNIWIKVLKDVTNSVLWLLRFPGDAVNNIHEFVATKGIDPVRIIFSNITSKDEHLRRIQLADIVLDTPFYNGHKSSLDALWTGTPIITMAGKTFASRITSSQLTALNCTEMITLNEYDYIKLAINLGMHRSLLDQTRQKIWEAKLKSELFDCKSYVENLEIIYLDIWNQFSSETYEYPHGTPILNE